MNKQIEEILIKLDIAQTDDFDESDYVTSPAQMVEFAKLIMQECSKACDTNDCGTIYSSKELIEMHFGIDL
jgi:hypothetical protein